MRRVLNLAVAALLSAFSAPAVSAQQAGGFPERNFGTWAVYGHNGKCWMLARKGVNGTIPTFALSGTRADMLFAAENRSWTWLRDHGSYNGDLILGDLTGAVEVGAKIDKGLGPMIAIWVEGDIFELLRGAGRAALTLDGKRLFDITFGETGPAVDYFEQCARKLEVGPFK